MTSAVTPPHVGDVQLAARALQWPRVSVGDRVIEGEAAWHQALRAMDPMLLWAALQRQERERAPRDEWDERLPDAAARHLIGGLRPVRPTAAQAALVKPVVDYARRVGLTLPPWRLRWCRPGSLDTLARGYTYHTIDPVLVLLNTEYPLNETAGTLLHELVHVHDARYQQLTTDERETRAEQFVAHHCDRLLRALRLPVAAADARGRRSHPSDPVVGAVVNATVHTRDRGLAAYWYGAGLPFVETDASRDRNNCVFTFDDPLGIAHDLSGRHSPRRWCPRPARSPSSSAGSTGRGRCWPSTPTRPARLVTATRDVSRSAGRRAELEHEHRELVDRARPSGIVLEDLPNNRAARTKEARDRETVENYNAVNAEAIRRGAVRRAETIADTRRG